MIETNVAFMMAIVGGIAAAIVTLVVAAFFRRERPRFVRALPPLEGEPGARAGSYEHVGQGIYLDRHSDGSVSIYVDGDRAGLAPAE